MFLVPAAQAQANNPSLDAAAGEGSARIAYRPAVPEGANLSPTGLDRFFDASKTYPDSVPAPQKQRRAAAAPAEVYLDLGAGFSRPAAKAPLAAPPVPDAAHRRTFRILLSSPERTDRYDGIIVKYAQLHSLNPRLLKAIIGAESEFVERALSPRGARGLMQLMGATAESFAVPRERLDDPESNIRAGAAYLAFLFRQAWRKFKLGPSMRFARAPLWVVRRIIAAYNAGPRFLELKAARRHTRGYIREVFLYYRSAVTDIRLRPAGPPRPSNRNDS